MADNYFPVDDDFVMEDPEMMMNSNKHKSQLLSENLIHADSADSLLASGSGTV